MKVLTDGGVRLEPIGPDRIVEIEPALAGEKDNLAGAIYCPTDKSGDCHKFTNALAEALAGDGRVTFHWSTPIERIVADGGRVTKVETGKGDFKADAYVVALGSYSPLLTRNLGLRLPIYPVKGYALTIPIGQRNTAPAICGVDEKYLIAWSRLGDRLRVTAKADFAGYDRSHSAKDFAHMLATIKGTVPRRRRLRQRPAVGGPASHDAQGHAHPGGQPTAEPVPQHRPRPHRLDHVARLRPHRRRHDRRPPRRHRHGRPDAGRCLIERLATVGRNRRSRIAPMLGP